MRQYLISRLLTSAVVLALLSILTFAIMQFLPGDPALAALGGRVASPEVVAQLREQLGLNEPPLTRYAHWLGGILQGDFGRSLRTGAPVVTEIALTLRPTVELAIAGLLSALAIGLPLGLVAALRRGTWVDLTTMSLAVIGVAMPSFWLGVLLISVFAFGLGWLPSGGTGDPRFLILPGLTLGFGPAAIIARMTRSSLLEVLDEDYIRAARARGLPEGTVLRHALRNAILPVVTTVGLLAGGLLSGAIIVEMVFSRPGVGRLLLQAVQARDFVLAQSLVFLFGGVYVVVNTAVDVAYSLLDPRIRHR